MKLSVKNFVIVATCWLLAINSHAATIITTNFNLSPADTSLEGGDLIISNCTVTMDGAHSFNSLNLGAGGSLTCTANPSGSATLSGMVTNEQFVLSGTNPSTLFYSDVSGSVSLTDTNQDLFTNGVDFVQTALGNQTQIARTTNSTIPDGATVVASYTWSAGFNTGLNFSVVSNLNVAAGGSITVNGGGYGGNNGSGYGNTAIGSFADGSGGGHGGNGGLSISNALGGAGFGSYYQPSTLGGAGGASYAGNGGNGGGRIQITATGSVNIDGMISANGAIGTNSRSGGGAGGSIWITAGNIFSGAGSLTANGGAGEPTRGGGGGGGRISIWCGTNVFTGSLNTYGGNGGKNGGGAGTVYIQTNGQTGQLTLDNGGLAGTNSVITLSPIANVFVQNGARLMPSSGSFNPRNLVIGTNGVLTMSSATSLSLTIPGNCTIQPGGALLADTNGYAPETGDSGSGGGMNSVNGIIYGGGGGHGGSGGVSSLAFAGIPNDSVAAPTDFGGGGGGMYAPNLGGAGGGALELNVTGTLQVDGKISAGGGDGSGTGGGGGAGGSIYIVNCNLLAGSGSISANGGNGVPVLGGGGGGGRIAVNFTAKSFRGIFSAAGGSGTNNGGAGTIYIKTNSASSGQIVLDNGGKPGAYSSLSGASSTDLIVSNGAVCLESGSTGFGNIIVSSNSILYVTNASSPNQITLTASSITVQAGGWISSDFGGYVGGSGFSSGAGNSSVATSPYYACGGAGHGGYGGFPTNATGSSYSGNGGAYDTASGPAQAGSGGGTYSSFSTGGRGGGALKLSVQNKVQIDGTVSANAGNGTGLGGGGGAGGSINIGCATFAGAGNLSANGGNGVTNVAGGGAGGMIYVNFTSSTFSGSATAYGGTGYGNGGAGTVYFQTNSGQSLLIVDNGGKRGSTNTPVSYYNNIFWTIRNGATVQASTPTFSINSLFIGTNSVLMPTFGGTLNFSVNGNVTIQPGGSIFADNGGSSQNSGSGRGTGYFNSPYPGGGGGHGGYGGNGSTNLGPGGSTYDSTASPSQSGSGGGSYNASVSPAGSGGGYVHLGVSGNLQLDGSISANGGSGAVGGGGGSGGTVYLYFYGNSSSTFNGSGSVSANGGNGGPYGGGGGGGRVAIYYYSNTVEHSTFNGTTTAYGGGGANYGGAGTVYIQITPQQIPQLILDNNNNAGTNTTFDSDYYDVTVQNKAIGILPSGSWTLDALAIRTNSALAGAPASPNSHDMFANNVTIDSGGAISLDNSGFSSSSGPGSAQFGAAIRGGGGYGGYGGGAYGVYGVPYGSIIAPSYSGSGGAGASYVNGGTGGGAFQLVVNGTLTMNGRISANGGKGDVGAGGGGGGSLYFPHVNTITGSGVISANGGSGTDNPTGGGAGGRIALIANVNNFTGQISTTGGGGTYPGAAGTIYKSIFGYQTLTIDNGGIAGTNTPLNSSFGLPSSPFDLNVVNKAIVAAASPLPLLNNFYLGAGSALTGTAGGIFVSVRTNANILGNIVLDNLGYAQGNGLGAGTNLNNNGSGGGYGGPGGNAASGAPGGITNGSATQPTDFGSGGGSGVNTVTGGSEGGGAVRLSVGGNLILGGTVSANGDYGWQDNSGGGAGGSIWIAANTISGAGNLSVAGGNGDLWNGGGGGGGRIAIYSPTNLFTGTTNAIGGLGYANGQNGTVYLSSSLLNFSVASMSPTGTVNNTVSYINLTFSDAIDPTSVAGSAFTLTTPTGTVDPSNFTTTVTGVTSIQLNFPLQNAVGTYTLTAAAPLASILGQPLQSFSGSFTISIPTVSGNVSDTNGVPVVGVSLQPDGGLPATMTDTNGNYSIPVPPGWTGGITPSLGQLLFVPGTLGLTNVTTSLTNQNFIAYQTLSPMVTSSFDGTNITLSWQSVSNVNYSVLDSTDLMNWTTYTGAGYFATGTNGLIQFIDPVNFGSPQLFYQLSITH